MTIDAARLSGTDMSDDHHPLTPRRDPERIDLGALRIDLELGSSRLEASDPPRAGSTTALYDRR
jgi:hypothetical protein